MIALSIIFNDILLSLSIILIYHLFLLNHIFNVLNLIYLLLEIGFFYCIIEIYQLAIILLKNTLVHYLTIVLILIYQYPIY